MTLNEANILYSMNIKHLNVEPARKIDYARLAGRKRAVMCKQ
jgi:hypothetical protein